MSSDATGIFINETHTSAAIWQYRVEKMLLEGKTQYQTYQIANVPRFGKSLFLDYNIQTSLLDEYIFHECMSQPAMTLHPDPKRVVVCGGGEGAGEGRGGGQRGHPLLTASAIKGKSG